MAPDLPFVPVPQGWSRHDHLRCVELYRRAGLDLTAQPLVGWAGKAASTPPLA